MTSAEESIRARRRLTNELIAGKDAQRLTPFFGPGAVLIPGDGTPIDGRDAIIEAFAGQFANPAFVAYVRETEQVSLDPGGKRAAEHGVWTGHWTGEATMGGHYLAVWRRVAGQWVIEREFYVTLS